MLFKIGKCPACRKFYIYFKSKKPEPQIFGGQTMLDTMVCKKCDQHLGIIKSQNGIEVKWLEYESLEEDNLIYHEKLDEIKKKIMQRIQNRNQKPRGRNHYFTKHYEKKLISKLTSLRTLINLKTRDEQRQLRQDLSIELRKFK